MCSCELGENPLLRKQCTITKKTASSTDFHLILWPRAGELVKAVALPSHSWAWISNIRGRGCWCNTAMNSGLLTSCSLRNTLITQQLFFFSLSLNIYLQILAPWTFRFVKNLLSRGQLLFIFGSEFCQKYVLTFWLKKQVDLCLIFFPWLVSVFL